MAANRKFRLQYYGVTLIFIPHAICSDNHQAMIGDYRFSSDNDPSPDYCHWSWHET